MIIKTKDKLKDLKGKDIDLTIGEAIGNILLAHKAGGKMKMYVLAQKMVKDGKVEVDDADFELIKGAIEVTEAYVNLVSGQLLVLLSELKK